MGDEIAYLEFTSTVSPASLTNRQGKLYVYTDSDGLYYTTPTGGDEINLTTAPGLNGAIVITYTARSTITAGRFVAVDTANDLSVVQATVANSARIIGVALDTVTTGNPVRVQVSGIAQVYLEQTLLIPVARGNRIEVNNNGAGTILSLSLGIPVYTNNTVGICLVDPTMNALNSCQLIYHV